MAYNSSFIIVPLFWRSSSKGTQQTSVILYEHFQFWNCFKFCQQKGGLAPLHIACAIPGEEGVQITELLLNALADPDVRATEDNSFINKNLVCTCLMYFYCYDRVVINNQIFTSTVISATMNIRTVFIHFSIKQLTYEPAIVLNVTWLCIKSIVA